MYNRLLKNPKTRETWLNSVANKFDRLMYDVGKPMPEGTKSIFLIRQRQVPACITFTYAKFVVDTCPLKTEAVVSWPHFPAPPSRPHT